MGTFVPTPNLSYSTLARWRLQFGIEVATTSLGFVGGKREFTKSLHAKEETVADLGVARVNDALMRLKRGLLEMPPEAEPGEFIVSGGTLTAKPKPADRRATHREPSDRSLQPNPCRTRQVVSHSRIPRVPPFLRQHPGIQGRRSEDYRPVHGAPDGRNEKALPASLPLKRRQILPEAPLIRVEKQSGRPGVLPSPGTVHLASACCGGCNFRTTLGPRALNPAEEAGEHASRAIRFIFRYGGDAAPFPCAGPN